MTPGRNIDYFAESINPVDPVMEMQCIFFGGNDRILKNYFPTFVVFLGIIHRPVFFI
jgi:hypothetical protein